MKKQKLLLGLVILGMLIGIFLIASNKEQKLSSNDEEITIPKGGVHLHPKLTIIVDGEQILIPPNIGSGIGKIIDTDLSGMQMSPTHTHESDGTIHIENNNPISKPETLTLGYFFFVWDETFNSTCIFENCTDKGTLKMYVNGKESTEFGDYIMQDEDNIRIEYQSNEK
ncbi:hypothetical protein HQ489_06060 [Candidatus Woesearchaeota archaeon]|nr:hypothetical protein [Candidatus Woesearchaeota archaeon]